jgi:hypothetical protein
MRRPRPLRLFLPLMAIGVWAACATKPGSAPPSLSEVLDERVTGASAIVWSAERSLTWEDFRGVPPPAPGEEGARTRYSLFYGARCVGKRFEFRVLAAVLPRESWVVPKVLADPALSVRSLRHEQTHFDLSEVHARRMRRYFTELATPCARTETELNALSQRLARDESAAQQRYDDETNYGRNPARQTEWNAEAARQIQSLKAYGAGR